VVVRRTSAPGGVAEAVAVAVVPLPCCTGTRPRPDGDGDGGTTTDDGDGGVPQSPKTTGNSRHRCLFPNPGDGAPILRALVGVAAGAHVVVVVVVVVGGGGVGVVGACHKSLPCGCFAVLLDARFRTLRTNEQEKTCFISNQRILYYYKYLFSKNV